jgi:hypothetical protein
MSLFGSSQFAAGFYDLATGDNVDLGLYGGDEAVSHFTREIKKSSWFTQLPVPLRAESASPSAPSYKVAKGIDFLLRTWLRARTPGIRVNDAKNYRIAFTPNLFHNICRKSQLAVNDLILQEFDNYWLDFHANYFTKEGKWKVYNQMIGNVPHLIEFSEYLPPTNIMLPLPFYYANDYSNSFPVCCLGLNDIRHHFELQADLSKLLRVQKFNSSSKQWDDVSPSGVAGLVKVDGGSDLHLKMPELWA